MVQFKKALFGTSILVTAVGVCPAVYAAPAVPLNVSTLGNSLTLGHNVDAVEYTRDFYGSGSLPGDSSNPGDGAYNPSSFSSWRASLQFELSEAGYDVDMLGTVNTAADLPDTLLDGLVPAQFMTTDGRTVTYDADHDGHSGWHTGGVYDQSRVLGTGSGLYNGMSAGSASWTYTAGQVANNTYRGAPVVAGDLVDTGANGLTLDGDNVFNRGLKDHLPEMDANLAQSDAIFIQIGINDLKNREDVEDTSLVSVTDRVANGNLQQRLYDIIVDVRSRSAGAAIYVSNFATVDDDFDWASTAEMQEAIDAFNQSFLDEYFSAGYQNLPGYDDAYAEGDLADGLGNVFLLNTHKRVDEIIGLDGTIYGGVDYTRALEADGLHWTEESNEYVGEYFASVTAATVPTPATAPLVLAGLGMVMARRRRA